MEKPLKLFVSYSHKDQEYHDDFCKHIKPMELSGDIAVWSDVKLNVGDKVTPEILQKLNESDVVVFLISADFFSSNFIVNEEVRKTLESEKTKKVIPVILKPCAWLMTGFKDYLAVPKDGFPIKSFPDRDIAWLQVVESIQKSILDLFTKEKVPEVLSGPKVRDVFYLKLNDLDVPFLHKNKEIVNLNDIFVYPDLKRLKDEYKDMENTFNSFELKSLEKERSKILIIGDEQTGKTSLAKTFTSGYFDQGLLSILIDGFQISTSDPEKMLEKYIVEQYETNDPSKYYSSNAKKIIIIDNFHKNTLNKNAQKKFFNNLGNKFDRIIVFIDKYVQYDESEISVFGNFFQYEILPFGHVKRGELIEKWNSIGQVETIDPKVLGGLVDSTTRHINAIIRGNIVPPRPIYILTLIQTLDAYKGNDHQLTSYGHCYQALILMALEKQKVKQVEYDIYFNYLLEISYFIFEKNISGLKHEDVEIFRTNYSSKFVIKDHDDIESILIRAKILNYTNGLLSFSYKYVYYFFVAKYLAEKADEKICETLISGLCKNVHTERNANILIFLVHHTKKAKIIDEILLNTMYVFDEYKEETLETKGLTFLKGFDTNLPALILEQKNTDKERKKQLVIKDRIESVKLNEEIQEKENGLVTENKFIGDIVRSVRSVEIIGQILRNYHGSLKKEDLKNLSTQSIAVGLRFLKAFFETSETLREPILEMLENILNDGRNISDEEVTKKAKDAYLTMCYQTTIGVVWKIANSIGEDRLVKIYEEISKDKSNSIAMKLIEIIIKLEYTEKTPQTEINNLAKELKNTNPFGFRVLQHILIQHLYLHHSSPAERQWISSTLNIPLKTQIRIERSNSQKQD